MEYQVGEEIILKNGERAIIKSIDGKKYNIVLHSGELKTISSLHIKCSAEM